MFCVTESIESGELLCQYVFDNLVRKQNAFFNKTGNVRKRNIEARSRNQCYHGKAISMIYVCVCVCVCVYARVCVHACWCPDAWACACARARVALIIQHRHTVLSSAASGPSTFFDIIL
jgi:hypothetical protein